LTKIKLNKVVDLIGWKAIGNKLADYSKSDQMDWVQLDKPNNIQGNLFE
jgi:topoisomerase-4 subunit A